MLVVVVVVVVGVLEGVSEGLSISRLGLAGDGRRRVGHPAC